MESAMITTSIIRIEEQENQSTEDQSYRAFVIFNHGERYPCQIRDPFADQPQQEADLEWYFEEHLKVPFTGTVRAREAAESIRAYGSALFSQVFSDPGARRSYQQARRNGLHTVRLEVAGSVAFQRLH